MNTTMKLTKRYFYEGRYTLTLLSDRRDCIKSTERGVAPLLALYEEGVCVEQFSAADRVVGRAAAFLYILLGVREVWAEVISQPAKALLEQHGIAVECRTETEMIRNRAGDGYCPMEQAVLNETDPSRALELIRRKRAELAEKRAN